MMTKLRELTKVFIIIVALSFIGMMVFEWGMDYTGRGNKAPDVGNVNGEKLSYEQFRNLYRQLLETRRDENERSISEEDQRNLRNMVWDQFVQSVLLKNEVENLHITVSDSEIVYKIIHYPLEQLKTNEAFLTDGKFDKSKYYAAFNNPDAGQFWLQVEQFYRQNLPYEKLQGLITSTVRVSDSEVEQEYIENELKARVTYLEIPYNKFNNPDIEITDDEIEDYYNDHLSDYHQEEKRSLSYVWFSLKPSKTDTARIFQDFMEIKNRLAQGEDFNELALIYSEDPYKDTNKGRYDYFTRGSMVRPFEDACFNGAIGEIVGPIETQYGFHLIKIEDKRIKDGKEEVRASHILLKVHAGPSTRERQETAAGFFVEDARTLGFDIAAERNEYKIEKIEPISETEQFIPRFGRNFNIPYFAFRAKPEEVSDLIETEDGIVVLRLDEINEAGPRPLDEVKNLVITRVRYEKAKQLALEFSHAIQKKIDNNIPFEIIAATDKEDIINYDSTGTFSLNSTEIQNHIFRATAFSINVGQISGMIETQRGLYWQKLLQKTEYDSTAYKNQYISIYYRLLMEKRKSIFESWYQYLKDKADITDNRRKLLL